MYRKILILAIFLLVLSGCKRDAELIEPYKITNQIFETLKDATMQGLYMSGNNQERLIIYRGIEKGIKTMSYTIEENVLTIFFETEEITQPQDYIYKITSNHLYDTILVSVDGQNEAFHTIFTVQ